VIFSIYVWVIVSNCAGERNPSVECRRRRLKKTSMYSKTSVLSSPFDGKDRPWMIHDSSMPHATQLGSIAGTGTAPLNGRARRSLGKQPPGSRSRRSASCSSRSLPVGRCPLSLCAMSSDPPRTRLPRRLPLVTSANRMGPGMRPLAGVGSASRHPRGVIADVDSSRAVAVTCGRVHPGVEGRGATWGAIYHW
jgi:hypothetical protein